MTSDEDPVDGDDEQEGWAYWYLYGMESAAAHPNNQCDQHGLGARTSMADPMQLAHRPAGANGKNPDFN